MNQYQRLIDNLTKLNLNNMAASIADYRQQIDEFATMSFLDNQENIIFIGSPGVGKTHLSIGIGIEACRQGVRTLFINCHELILRLKSAQEKQHLERVMRRYERYDLLIIDELGYLPISANESKLLFQLINGRYERKSTIITTNVPLSSWGTVLNSMATAEAILERLVYHSHVIKLKGKLYSIGQFLNRPNHTFLNRHKTTI
ncbi:IS21-like element helper ATPase IstB [Ligilactobacillus ruminis]|uniref:IS21-like element helper ATPase IstB n=1 Tax=Ligilactobacillus ruminis TaxID=1623 RepID=UPI0009B9721A|nr:IS21-like element helper ATPase IstB [Ligilactobacillus ruminis]